MKRLLIIKMLRISTFTNTVKRKSVKHFTCFLCRRFGSRRSFLYTDLTAQSSIDTRSTSSSTPTIHWHVSRDLINFSLPTIKWSSKRDIGERLGEGRGTELPKWILESQLLLSLCVKKVDCGDFLEKERFDLREKNK